MLAQVSPLPEPLFWLMGRICNWELLTFHPDLSDKKQNIYQLGIRKTRKHQKTLKVEFSFDGMGVFSGRMTEFTARPSEPDSGIVFIRDGISIPAHIKYVEECPNRTKLAKDNAAIQVVEHLLAAFLGLGVDNAEIFCPRDEIPILDASAKDYVEKIQEVGLVEQDAFKSEIIVNKPVFEFDNDAMIAVLPDKEHRITYILDHQHHKIGRMADSLVLNNENFARFIGPARTFATREEANYMIENRIVSTDDENLAIIVGPTGPNQELRHPLEFVHHKMLDMLGDLSLVGFPIRGHLLGVRSGHAMNRRLAAKIAKIIIRAVNS